MGLIKTLNVTFDKPALYCVGAKCGIGKTSFLATLSGELVSNDKHVLYLTNEVHGKDIIKKIHKNLPIKIVLNGLIKVKNFTEVNLSVDEAFQEDYFDVVIIDGDFSPSIETYKEIINNYECSVIISYQLSSTAIDDRIKSIPNISMIQKSDVSLILTRKIHVDDFFENLKYFICFWLDKPNLRVNVIKNRFGKESANDIKINF